MKTAVVMNTTVVVQRLSTAVNHTPARYVTPTLAARAHSPEREHICLAAGATAA
jgi:hypothetical protein